MRKTLLFSCLGGGILLLSAFTAVLHTSGNIFTTGSPFDGGTCGQCHSGTVGSTSVTVAASPAFGPGNTYLPGGTYTVSATVSGTFILYGFNLEMLNSNSSVSAVDAGMCGMPVTSNCQKIVSAGNPTNYTHTGPSGSANSATFSFQWTAPSSGPAYIYCAGLGVNGNGANSGDKVATYSVMLSPASGVAETSEADLGLRFSPNPVTNEVRLAYDLHTRGQVIVTLRDLEGRALLSLIHEEQGPGTHEATCRLPGELAHGIYFLNLEVNGMRSVKKLMVH